MAYRSPHMVHCKPAPQQKIRSFALNPTVACQSLVGGDGRPDPGQSLPNRLQNHPLQC